MGEAPVVLQPAVEGRQGGHRGRDVVLQALLDAAREGREEEGAAEALLVHHLQARVAVLVLGVLGERLDLHEGAGVDALGDLAPEERVEAAGHDDRVEGGVGMNPLTLPPISTLTRLPSCTAFTPRSANFLSRWRVQESSVS